MRFAHRVVVAGSAVVLTWGATLGVTPVSAQQSPFGVPAPATSAAPAGTSPTDAAAADLQWLTNLDTALQQAAAQRKFVLVHFWNDNCAPCVAVEKNVFSRPEVKQAIQANFIAVKIKVDDQPEVAKKYRVDRWPTDVLLSSDGRELYRTVTSQNPNQYVALLNRIATTARGSMAAVQDATKTANQWADRVTNTIPQFGANPAANSGANSGGSSGGNFPAGVPAAFAAANNAFAANPANAAPPPPVAETPPTAAAPPATPPAPAAFAGNAANANGGAFRASADNGPLESRSSFVPGGSAAPPPPAPSTASPPATSSFAPNQFAAPGSPPAAAPTAPPMNGGGFAPPAASPPPRIAQAFGAPPPAGQTPAAPNSPAPNATAPKSPGLGLEGFCPVTLQSTRKWRRGDARWGVVHRDRTYLFAGPDEQRLFLENPDKFAPMLSGYDPVRYAEQGQLVDGRRQHGVWYRNQMYLFADEVSLEKFWKSPDMVVPRVEQAMRATAAGGVRR